MNKPKRRREVREAAASNRQYSSARDRHYYFRAGCFALWRIGREGHQTISLICGRRNGTAEAIG